MTPADSQPSREDVLSAFAVEPDRGREILEQYLRDYPQYATDLIDLSYELSREVYEDDTSLSDEDLALIDKAWQRHASTDSRKAVNLLAALSAAEQRNLARRLDVPRQVITAFRERRVELASVPRLFVERFASEMGSTLEVLMNSLAQPSVLDQARSYKADDRPEAQAPVTFEQILLEADVPPDKRAMLMADES